MTPSAVLESMMSQGVEHKGTWSSMTGALLAVIGAAPT
jgi:hypothetical protein